MCQREQVEPPSVSVSLSLSSCQRVLSVWSSSLCSSLRDSSGLMMMMMMMMMRAASGLFLILLTATPVSAQFSAYDPTYCYILDGLLLLYAIIITGFFVRERFTKSRTMDKEPLYQPINKGGKSEYDMPSRTQRGSEEGRSGGGRRRVDDTYTPLNRKTEDTYRELENKGDRRRPDQVYQGLSSMTKDTYDSLQMQQLHPPPR